MPPPERVWSDDDWAVIRLGHRPVGMDDRWSAYVESDTLHLHRSWTGHQIYEARFGRTQGGRFMVAARVEADRGRHRRVGDAYDRLLLELLVDTILLQRHAPPPMGRAGVPAVRRAAVRPDNPDAVRPRARLWSSSCHSPPAPGMRREAPRHR